MEDGGERAVEELGVQGKDTCESDKEGKQEPEMSESLPEIDDLSGINP
jgi:hypothetical protein